MRSTLKPVLRNLFLENPVFEISIANRLLKPLLKPFSKSARETVLETVHETRLETAIETSPEIGPETGTVKFPGPPGPTRIS